MPYARVRDVALHFDESGPKSGPVVAFLHGAFGSASDWTPHRRALGEAGYRALALDDRGHGRSTRYGAPGQDPLGAPGPVNAWSALTMETLVADARAWLDAVAPRARVHLVGHSRGGTVAAWLAVELGAERVPSFVAAATPPQASEAFRAFFRRLAEKGELPRGYDGELAAATNRYLAAIPDDAFPAELMTQYKGAALVLEGGRDPLYSPTHTAFWRAWARRSHVARFDDGGHAFPFDGGAGEAWFRAELVAHLTEVAGSDGERRVAR